MNSKARDLSELIVHSADPLNVEPPLTRLLATFLTPQRDFYIRSHEEISHLDAATPKVAIVGGNGDVQSFTLADLQSRFAQLDVMVAMHCAGNRRAAMRAVASVAGIPWGRE